MRKLKKSLLLFVIPLIAACGPQYENNQDGEFLDGSIAVDGSSTVYPILEAVTEEYAKTQPYVQVSVGVSGTGGGFQKLINGEIEISNASRKIKDEEIQALELSNIDYLEFEIAYDGLSVIVNKENNWIDYLTIEELKKIWIEDGTVKKWSDIRAGWPDEEIKLYSPGTDSGTFDYFNEVVLEEQQMVQNVFLSEDDNMIVTGVSGDPYALGFLGYAYFSENRDKLKAVPIDGGTGPVEPSNETIESGEYSPLSRALYLYVRNDALKRPDVVNFLQFTFKHVGLLSEEVGYVKAPQKVYDESLNNLEG